MPRYVMLLAIAILSLLIIYAIVLPAQMKLKWKLLIFMLSFASAGLTYFSARDIFGRADKYPLPGKYNIRFAEKNKKDGKIYVYVTSKRGDPSFEPRLLVLDPTEMNGSKSDGHIGKMLEIGQEGQGQLKLELRKKRAWYGPNESTISVQDPLIDVLQPKE